MCHGAPRCLALAVCASCFTIWAQSNLVVNGSFESGLAGWTVASDFPLLPPSTGTCSYNAVQGPGSELLTGLTGFTATDGRALALGSASFTSGTSYQAHACSLYQEITVPPGTVCLTLNLTPLTRGRAKGTLLLIASLGVYPATYTYWVPVLSVPLCSNSDSTLSAHSAAGD